jgi:hypothetical protein
MNSENPERPVLLILDPSLTFSRILTIILNREGYDVEIVAFQEVGMALFWLSGEMDRRKAHYPFVSPWDHYPALKPSTLAIVSLAFPAHHCNHLLALLLLQEPPRPHLFTTSTKEELSVNQSQGYWGHVVSHIPRPLKVADVLERLRPFLQK